MSTPPPDQPSGSPNHPPYASRYGGYPEPYPVPGEQPGDELGSTAPNPYATRPRQDIPPPPARPPTPVRRSGHSLMWALCGAVAASTLWGGGTMLVGAHSAVPELRGYTAPANLCSVADYSSFRNEYPQTDGRPVGSRINDPAIDLAECNISLEQAGSTYADSYLMVEVDLHKKTDPGPEFTALWRNYQKRYPGYEVHKVTGIGDEAYLVTEDNTASGSSGSRTAILAVRDGWMTYQMSWTAYLSSTLSSSDASGDQPEVSEVGEWLKSDTTRTLAKLKG